MTNTLKYTFKCALFKHLENTFHILKYNYFNEFTNILKHMNPLFHRRGLSLVLD